MKCTKYLDEQGRPRLRWQCPFCEHAWNLHAGDASFMPFMVVHHWAGKHGMSGKGILRLESTFGDAVSEYFWSEDALEPSLTAVEKDPS